MAWVNFVTRLHCEIDSWLVLYLDWETYKCLIGSHNFGPRLTWIINMSLLGFLKGMFMELFKKDVRHVFSKPRCPSYLPDVNLVAPDNWVSYYKDSPRKRNTWCFPAGMLCLLSYSILLVVIKGWFFSPASSLSPGNFLKVQILGPHLRTTESESQVEGEGWGAAVCVLTVPWGNSDTYSRLRTIALSDLDAKCGLW